MSEFAHLDEAVRAVAALPAGERIERLRQPHWIGYTRSKRILDRLEDLLQYPRVHRMPNLLIVGETNNGKTVIVNRFQRLHPAADNPDGDHAIVPVLLIQAPPAPEENRFYSAILEALAAPYKSRGSAAEKQIQVLHLLRGVQLRLLIIDEIHHILAGHIAKQRQFLNVLKHLGNELQIPLVGVGTMDAVRAIQTDPQMANRFEPVALPRWEMNRDFQMLLASFERILPLQQPSRLAEPALAARLLALSEGTIGELSSLLVVAAAQAIRSGAERIDEDVLIKTGWTPPSVRRRQIEKLT
jgi:type II secretory pathway predicted ATPase ExeA